MQLVADRFVVEDRSELRDGHAIDLATGERAVLTIGSAGGVSEQTRWTLRCDGLHRLHHRAIAPLLDFGLVGESSRFEAWRCAGTWQGSADVARGVHDRASHFLRVSGLTTTASGLESVRAGTTGAVLLRDSAGHGGADVACAANNGHFAIHRYSFKQRLITKARKSTKNTKNSLYKACFVLFVTS